MSIMELKTRPAQVKADVVERLAELLEKATRGEIESVAIAAVETGGVLVSTWSQTDDFGRLLGAVARLEHRLNANQNVY
jgi:alpha-beta hydrolase superfamily lysophospholipase